LQLALNLIKCTTQLTANPNQTKTKTQGETQHNQCPNLLYIIYTLIHHMALTKAYHLSPLQIMAELQAVVGVNSHCLQHTALLDTGNNSAKASSGMFDSSSVRNLHCTSLVRPWRAGSDALLSSFAAALSRLPTVALILCTYSQWGYPATP
jgi:hypothetical protein